MIEAIRIAEAMVFAAEGPIDEGEIAKRIPDGLKIGDVMQEVRADYQNRGVNLIRAGRKWTFRTAADLGWLLSKEMQQQKKLSRAALETWRSSPITSRSRARRSRTSGASPSPRHARCAHGNRLGAPAWPTQGAGPAVTYGTTDDFLLHFGLEGITDLPGLDELKGAGLFDGRLPPGFGRADANDSAE